MSHPGDFRWDLKAPDYRPSIAVIETPPRRLPPGPEERVPFGFARVLMPSGLCGKPNRNGSLGGCIEPIGHDTTRTPHRWATGEQRGAVRSTWPQPAP